MIEQDVGSLLMASVNRGVVFQQIDRLYRDGTLSGLGDGQLLERYLTRGDEAAFETLVNLHGPMVLSLCRRVLRDPRDIEDAFQATFLILVRKAATIRDRGLLSNWLYGVAYRVARRARANMLRRRDREIAVGNLEAPAAPETADSLGIGAVLDQELNRLPRKYRAPLILCYLNGHTHDQAAEELECPVGTVRSRLARGRDLLRRRLTSRGHAPTAALLGTQVALPARLLTEAVPPSLVSATVDAALGIGASKTIQTGVVSAAALALTQGVLTTMRVVQLKVIGLAILATGLSASGVVAVSYAAGQGPQDPLDANSVVLNATNPVAQSEIQTSVERPVQASPSTEKRLRALEAKLDELLNRSTTAATPTGKPTINSKDALGRGRASTKQDEDRGRMVDSQHRSIQELEAELDLAVANDTGSQKLFDQHVISSLERYQTHAKVLLIKAMLEGRFDELSDEIDRLKLEIKTKRAQREKSIAQSEVGLSVVARNTRLNDRKPGMVSAEDVAKGEWEMKAASAQVAIVEAEIAEIELRVQQLERRRGRIRQIIKLAEPAKPTDGAVSPTSPAGGTPR
jgi:RNA polymerase sigma factor (sigma-70 family)